MLGIAERRGGVSVGWQWESGIGMWEVLVLVVLVVLVVGMLGSSPWPWEPSCAHMDSLRVIWVWRIKEYRRTAL